MPCTYVCRNVYMQKKLKKIQDDDDEGKKHKI